MAGHLFITHGDLTRLSCDAWILPTDSVGHVMPHWLEAVGSHPRMLANSSAKLQAERVVALGPAREDGPFVVAVNSGQYGRDAEWFADGLLAAIDAATDAIGTTARNRRDRPLIGVPLAGVGAGGGGEFRGDVVREEVARLQEFVVRDPRRVDLALVTYSERHFAAAQAARRTHLEATGTEPWKDLTTEEHSAAAELGRLALDGKLVLFLGSGISVGAGLPLWGELIRDLALAGEMDPDDAEFERLDILDQAEVVRRNLGERRFRQEIKGRFTRESQALMHQMLASLPVTESATTNYDTLFEDAWSVVAGPDQVAVLPERSLQSASRWLLKLHGSVRGKSTDLVLCREDYLRLGNQRAALAGVVQAMLLTKRMLFVGFSLTDDTFHRIAHEVRDVLGPADSRPGGRSFGTALSPTGGDLARKLWEGDIELIDMSRGAALSEAVRRIELFLDRLLFETADPLAHFLDPTFGGVLSKNEQALAEALRDLGGGLPASRLGDALGMVLKRMGGS